MAKPINQHKAMAMGEAYPQKSGTKGGGKPTKK